MLVENMNGVNVLITGGMGFVGSNLAHKLVELGANVTLYDALLKDYGGNWANIREIKDEVEVVIGDVRDYNKLKGYVKKADIIYHCAAQVSRVISMFNPRLDIEINCIGTINMLEATRKCENKDVKVVYTSSRAVTGLAKNLPVNEGTPINPVDIYGANKYASENYCKIYRRAYGLKTIILKLNNCYGPRAQLKTPTYGVIGWWIRLALENKVLPVFEPGTQLRDYNYIDDVVDALVIVSQRDEAVNDDFYLGSGKPVQLIELAKLIVKVAGTGKIKVVLSPREWKSIEIGNFYATYRKIKEKLGWYPKTDLETGLRKTIEFYKKWLREYI